MAKTVRIKQIHTDSLACEPILRRTANGELLCICQCDGPCEPHEDNRVYAFHSRDNGESWEKGDSIYPEDGQAVYCTEVTVDGDEITAYLSTHNGKFLDWKCVMMKSYDNGYTWKNGGTPPHFPEYTFIRGRLYRSDGTELIPYQHYPVTREGRDRVVADDTLPEKGVWFTGVDHCETGVLIREKGSTDYTPYFAFSVDHSLDFTWTEPTLAELSDGRIAMIVRRDCTKRLWYSESKDGGKTWCAPIDTGIPSPTNKTKLLALPDRKIAMLHTPNKLGRYPISLWISDDDMKTWSSKTVLTDFPGFYNYSDGFYENGHILFTIEHNRHTILFFDVEL